MSGPGEKLEELEEALREAGDDPLLQAEALAAIGAHHLDQASLEEAGVAIDAALTQARKAGNAHLETALINNRSFLAVERGEIAPGLAGYAKALELLGDVDNDRMLAQIHTNRAIAYQKLGDGYAAEHAWREALRFWQATDNRASEAWALNSIALILIDRSAHTPALKLCQQLLPLYEELSDLAGQTTTLLHIGMLQRSLGDRDAAMASLQRALAVCERESGHIHHSLILGGIGQLHEARGEVAQALACYHRKLEAHQANGEGNEELETLNNIATTAQGGGKFREAMEHYELALAVASEAEDRESEIRTLQNLASLNQVLGRPELAMSGFLEALEKARGLEDPKLEGVILNNLGLLHQEIGLAKEGAVYRQEALAARRRAGDRAGEATSLHNIAYEHQANGEHAEALRLYREVLEIRREVGDRKGEGTTLGNIGTAQSALGDRESALQTLREALDLRRAIGDRGEEVTALVNLGHLHATGLEFDAARSYMGQAVELIEAMRSGAPGGETRMTYFENEASVYASLAKIHLNLGEDAEAFRCSENVRARLQVDRLADGLHLTPAPADERPIEAWELAAVQARLPDDTALLEYLLADEHLILFYVTRDAFQAVVIGAVAPKVAAMVKELLDAVRPIGGGPQTGRYPHGHELFEILFPAPVRERLSAESIAEIAVCPDGPLHYLPFCLLLREEPDEKLGSDGETWHWSRLPYLISKSGGLSLRYVSSGTAAAMGADHARQAPAAERAFDTELQLLAAPLLDADPRRAGEAEKLPMELSGSLGRELSRLSLPGAEEEIRCITAGFSPEEVEIDATADREAFLALIKPSRDRSARYTHVLCHGVSDERRPELSGFVLEPESDSETASYVRASEISAGRIETALLVASACNVNHGRVMRGEGMLALTHALLLCGAESVLSSLWEVFDPSVPRFMDELYRQLQSGARSAEALRRAQLLMASLQGSAEPFAHPSHWAAFTLYGQGAATARSTADTA